MERCRAVVAETALIAIDAKEIVNEVLADDAFDTPHGTPLSTPTPYGTPLSTPWRSGWEAAQCTAFFPDYEDCGSPAIGDAPIELCNAPLCESSQLIIDDVSPVRIPCPADDDPAVIRASWSQADYNAYQTFATMCTEYPGASDMNRNQWRTVLNMPDAMWRMVHNGDPLRAQV